MRRSLVDRTKWMGVCAAIVAAFGLGGCLTRPAARANVAMFDLGDVTVMAPAQTWLGSVDVSAPSWLESRAMQYRLAAEPARRQSYAEHRWAANPSELLAAALRRQLGAVGEGCRLHGELDEWVQAFDGDGNSTVQVALRAALLPARSDAVIGRQTFVAKAPAGRNAEQGVAAFVSLEQQVAGDMNQWLTKVGKEQKDMAARCRS